MDRVIIMFSFVCLTIILPYCDNFHFFPDTQPQCEQDQTEYIAGEDAEISCKVTFAGRWAPTMAWDNTEDTIRNETSGSEAKWAFTRAVTADDNGRVFTCTTTYDAPTNPGDDEASNAPVIDSVQPCSVTLTVLCEYACIL